MLKQHLLCLPDHIPDSPAHEYVRTRILILGGFQYFLIIPFYPLHLCGKIIITFEYLHPAYHTGVFILDIAVVVLPLLSFEVNISRCSSSPLLSVLALDCSSTAFYLGIRNYYKKRIIFFKKSTDTRLQRYRQETHPVFYRGWDQYQIIGFVEDEGNVHELTHYPVLSGIGKYPADRQG